MARPANGESTCTATPTTPPKPADTRTSDAAAVPNEKPNEAIATTAMAATNPAASK